MTPDQLKSLRALAESTANQTGPTVFGSVAWYRGRAIELAQAVPALIEEVEKLRRDMASPLKLCIGQRDAALDREDALRAQLSAMTAARDEACEIGEEFIPEDYEPAYSRIAELRKVGQ